MKNFVMGLLVVIAIIAVIVVIKRIAGHDDPLVNDNQTDSSSIDIGTGEGGETLPQ